MAHEPSQETYEARRSPAQPARGVALTIAFHPDLDRVGDVAYLDAGRVDLSREGPPFAPPGGQGRPLADRRVSRTPVRLRVGADRSLHIETAGGGVAVNGHPVAGAVEIAPAHTDAGVTLELGDGVVLVAHARSGASGTRPDDHGLVGANEAVDALRRNIARVADLPVPVLIRGETGTGKELVARAVHRASRRAGRPFVAVNIAAIPPATAASLLFGHTRGAFTGAVDDHAGYFAEAHTGSLFLDEIGATPQDIQPMLLRALEAEEVWPLGAAAPRTVDARLLAATDADLEQAIADESFRAALLHRLEGYQVFVPALRERRDDIGRLLVHFLRAELDAIGEGHKLEPPAGDRPTWLPASFVARLVRMRWPGNVRQLKNTVRQFTISSRGADALVVDAALSRLLAAADAPPEAPVNGPAESDKRVPSDIGDDELIAALRASDWVATKAAARLGVSRSYLYERMRSCDRIPSASDLDARSIVACRDACGGNLGETARRLEVSRRALMLRMKELGLS